MDGGAGPFLLHRQAACLLADLKSHTRGWSAIVVGEGTRCWFGNQFRLVAIRSSSPQGDRPRTHPAAAQRAGDAPPQTRAPAGRARGDQGSGSDQRAPGRSRKPYGRWPSGARSPTSTTSDSTTGRPRCSQMRRCREHPDFPAPRSTTAWVGCGGGCTRGRRATSSRPSPRPWSSRIPGGWPTPRHGS